ncbi:MAG: autotransporter assembly complex protein TamA [Sphingomonadaceae bacterium]
MVLTGSAAASLAVAQAQTTAPADPFDDDAFERSLPALEPDLPEPVVPELETPPPELDAELDAPLPSIAAVEAAPAIVVEDTSLPAIRYRVTLTGLREVGLEDRFEDLSALFDKGRRAENSAQITARAAEDAKLAERLLQSEGFYDATATALVGPLPDASGQLPVVISAVAGTRYTLGDISVTGASTGPTVLARSALGLRRGDPIVAAAIESAEARVALSLPEQGFPFAAVGARDILLDETTFTGDYRLAIDPGPRARFGVLRPDGDPVFDAEHLAIFPRFEAGQIYDARRVDDLRQALVATSLFATAAVEPVRTGVINADGTETVDLIVRQVKGPWRTLAGSAGYSTGQGIKLQGSWTHRNLFPPEGALIAEAIVGTQEQGAGVNFRRSNAGLRDRTFQIAGSFARQRFAAFDAETIAVSSSLARVSTPLWQKRWTYSGGVEIIATRETRFEATQAERVRSNYFIGALPLQLGHDRSNSLLDPTRGFRVNLRLSPEVQQRGGSADFDSYVSALVETSGYWSITEPLVLAARARIGAIVGTRRDAIAPSRRLYAGGGGSVRGFGYQALGPRDLNGDPIGGKSLTEFALEARYRFGSFGIVPFIDVGRIGESATPSLSDLRFGAGIGGRYYTNFGPMRIDVATPIGRRPGEPRVALYLSIGQAF